MRARSRRLAFAGGLAGLTWSLVASAADIVCGGHITMTMADHPACGGYFAFKTDTSGDVWMCAKSNGAGAVLLAALMSDKQVGVWIEGSDVGSCTALPNYRQISYMIIYP